MTLNEIDAIVEQLSDKVTEGIVHVEIAQILTLELEKNWDAIPGETRAILLGTAVALRNLLKPGSMLAEVIAGEFVRQSKAKGGRRPGSKERATDYIVDLLRKNPHVKPAEIVDEIFRCADADDNSPFVVDDCREDTLIDIDKSKIVDRAALTAKVSKAKYLYQRSAAKKRQQNLPKTPDGRFGSLSCSHTFHNQENK